ncbi:MAG: AAA family ATPase [Deltaproteobacteria bacterium]|jgi:general secretion pathway protein A|nr:AAA family ATPase [Deltaproteobacteria bacterium]
MYESFYGLTEKPFSLTPNPRFLFLSKTHNEVYAHLLYGIENKSGFIMVTGEVGTGKTTILRSLLKNLDEHTYRLAFIFNPKLTAKELLQNINREFGIDDTARQLPDMIEQLNQFLLAENNAGRVPVLVIDEAQNLSGEVLEQIRLLSNLETETDKLIQIVFVGQPELELQLKDPSLRQLNQRIAVRYRLVPLNSAETTAYIVNRLKVAGRPDGNVFNHSALKKIFLSSGGVPRMINLICDRALLAASNDQSGQVKAAHVRQAVLELSGEHARLNSPRLAWRPLAFIAILVVVIAAIYQWAPMDFSNLFGDNQVVAQVSAVEETPQVKENEPIEPVAKLPSKITATNAVLKEWTGEQIPTDLNPSAFDVEDLFQLHELQVMKLRGTFSQLVKFNMPFVFVTEQNGQPEYRAVIRKMAAEWHIIPEFHGALSSADLLREEYADLIAYLPWKDFAEVGYVATPGLQDSRVRALQRLLSQAGEFKGPLNGAYDQKTIAAVKLFQARIGLGIDGLVGPRTLAALYAASDVYDLPRLY